MYTYTRCENCSKSIPESTEMYCEDCGSICKLQIENQKLKVDLSYVMYLAEKKSNNNPTEVLSEILTYLNTMWV